MNDKENMILKKRIAELADATWQRDVPSCTDFLGLEEQTVFHSVLHDLPPVRYLLDGGYEDAERRVVCFLLPHDAKLDCQMVGWLRTVDSYDSALMPAY